jgi:signal transduction histidine kinase
LAGTLQIAVTDEGPGLPEEMAALLDEVAPAAGYMQEGKGLGLWMSGHLIRRLGGHAEVERPGIGTRLVVSLPFASKQVPDAG